MNLLRAARGTAAHRVLSLGVLPYRPGRCRSGNADRVEERRIFSLFQKQGGNDLSTPLPEFGFPGLKPGGPLVSLCCAMARGLRSGEKHLGSFSAQPIKATLELIELAYSSRTRLILARPANYARCRAALVMACARPLEYARLDRPRVRWLASRHRDVRNRAIRFALDVTRPTCAAVAIDPKSVQYHVRQYSLPQPRQLPHRTENHQPCIGTDSRVRDAAGIC